MTLATSLTSPHTAYGRNPDCVGGGRVTNRRRQSGANGLDSSEVAY